MADKLKCGRCKRKKSALEFSRNRTTKRGYQWTCKSCRRGIPENPERTRRYGLKRKYGLSEDQYIALLDSQEGRCALCGSTDPGWKKSWLVDHDHETNKTRAILCVSCNTGLGKFKDSPQLLRKAALYIEWHKI
jgi:hypothetical protein